MARTDYRFFHTLRVRWAEVDRQGVVFNGNYLHYFDVGVTEYWRAIGYPYPDELVKHGTDLYVVKASVEYHASALYDDMLDIGMRVARIGRSSVHFRPEIYRSEELIASGELIYVNTDPVAKKSAPVPQFLREAIVSFEITAPDLS
jgi:acyl-CoA thioester hydrolase